MSCKENDIFLENQLENCKECDGAGEHSKVDEFGDTIMVKCHCQELPDDDFSGASDEPGISNDR